MTIKPLDLEKLIEKATNVHEAIVAASRRARQINDEIKIEFNQRVETIVPKSTGEGEENDINPDQLRVAMEFEKRPKPTETAIRELLDSKLDWRYKEPPPEIVVKEEEEEEAEEE